MSMPSICIIGAGVSGLTTAIELTGKGYHVTVFADATGQSTTSSAAAAFWYPFWTGAKPDHSWYRPAWAWHSFLSLEAFVGDVDTGVTRTELLEYFDASMATQEVTAVIEGMWWRKMKRLHFKPLPASTMGGRNFQSGITFQTLVINMSCYLEFLKRTLKGKISKKHIKPDDLSALCKEFEYVVNCSGFGARTLVDDETLATVEGVVVRRTSLASINNILLLHTGELFEEHPVYVVPRGGTNPDIVVGGTLTKFRKGRPRHFEGSQLPDHEQLVRADVEDILSTSCAILPELDQTKSVGISVGYRPVRLSTDSRSPHDQRTEPVRLEPQFQGPFAGRIIHNYGHGGAGVTLSWGCAREVGMWIDWLSNS